VVAASSDCQHELIYAHVLIRPWHLLLHLDAP
jgi:hypothetical protein